MKPFVHASLFSGIGGAEVAASWMGWHNAFHCEIQEFPRRVLEYWFPNSVSYEDITKTDFSKWRGRIDILTGGFPCQPFSLAGKRGGADDNRYLWPQMLRAIREIQPAWVVGENVAGLLTMVQPCEEADMGCDGSLFEENHIYRKEQDFTIEEICRGLEREGYTVQPLVIPACAVGAPHQRERVWIVAHSASGGNRGRPCKVRKVQWRQDGKLNAQSFEHGEVQARTAADTECQRPIPCQQCQQPRLEERLSSGCCADVADANGTRQGERTDKQEQVTECHGTTYTCVGGTNGAAHNSRCDRRDEGELHDGRAEKQPCGADSPQDWWRDFPTQPPVCSRDDGLPFDVDCLTLSFAKWRSETIKAYGNAWVPQVAYEISRAIEQTENSH